MSRAERQRRIQEQRQAGGETFADVLRRMAGRPPLAFKVVLVIAVTTTVGMVLFDPPYDMVLTWLIGVPVGVRLIRRSR
jgi:hypothetical protein